MKMYMVCFAVAFSLLTVTVDAAEKEAKKKKGGNQIPQALRLPASIELTAEQEEKIAPIQESMMAEAKELAKEMRDVVPADVRKKQQAAMKEAREAGKSQQEIRKMVMEMQSDLSEADQAKLKETRAKMQTLKTAFLAKVKPILTEEQVAQLPAGRKGKGKGASSKKKKKKTEA